MPNTSKDKELRSKLLNLPRPTQQEMEYRKTLEVYTDDLVELINSEVRQALDRLIAEESKINEERNAVRLLEAERKRYE